VDYIYRFGRLDIFVINFYFTLCMQWAASDGCAVAPDSFFAAKKSIKNSVHTGQAVQGGILVKKSLLTIFVQLILWENT
jgi:hypothetical protein